MGKRDKATEDRIEARRELVARLRCRGLSCREIAKKLGTIAEWAAVNHATVATDIQALEAQWRESAMAEITGLKARQYAEIQEAKREAWSKSNLKALCTLLKREADLMGLDAPTKVAPTDPTGTQPYQPEDLASLSDEELRARRERLGITTEPAPGA